MRLLIGFLFVFTILYAEGIEIYEIDEYKSDIYYGNGIMTTEDEAQSSLDETLKPAILYEIYNGDKTKMNNGLHFDVAYNWSAKEKFGDTPIAMALDFMESYDQLGNTSWGWWTAQSMVSFLFGKISLLQRFEGASANMVAKALKSYGMPDAVADFMAEKIAENGIGVFEDMAKAMVAFDADEMHDKNLDEMVNAYKKSIRSGHGVIMVTHSQGNLFAVEASDRIVGRTELPILGNEPWMKKYLYHISIASPANRYARSNYHWGWTYDNDPITKIPASIGPRFTNYTRYFSHKCTITPSTGTATQIGWLNNPPVNSESPAGYWMSGNRPKDYTVKQNYYDPALQISQPYRFEVKADEWEWFQEKLHAFDFYMGKTVYTLYKTPTQRWTPPKDPKTGEYKSDAHNFIVKVISDAIEMHKKQVSQWVPKNVGCTCKEKYARMIHRFSPETMNRYLQDAKVKDFAEGDKTLLSAPPILLQTMLL